MWVVVNKFKIVVKLLLEIGKVEIDFKNKYNRTPLREAVENRHKAVVKLLLKISKIEVDSKDKDGRTPLW